MNPRALIEGLVYRCKTSNGFARKIVCYLDDLDVLIWSYLYYPPRTSTKNGICAPNTFAKYAICTLDISLNTNDACDRLKKWLDRGLNHRYYYERPSVNYISENNSFLVIPKYDTPQIVNSWEGREVVYYNNRR